MIKLLKSVRLAVLILFIFITGYSATSHAVSITWTGRGIDTLASDQDNWSVPLLPGDGDDLILDSTSSQNCTWDLDIAPASLTIDSGYLGILTLNTDLTVTGEVTVADGTLNQNGRNLLIGFAPPAGITDSAVSTNGDSTALNATINPNGLDTTVYFQCRTGAVYDISTTPQLIGNGTNNVSVSAELINLSPDTLYYCRVVVSSLAGTRYGSDLSFTTSPVILTIIYPAGGTINRPDVTATGTITNSTDNETGVTVNGIVATVYNGQFFVNHVPLQEGQNTITATATDTAGHTATTSITVDAATTTPYITLDANIESGISPLTTYFTVSTSIPNSTATYEMDYNGDEIIDYTGTTFDNISAAYTIEGVYYPTITVTDDQSNTYTDTIAIVVLNTAELDALLRAKWNAMKTALGNQDVNTALNYYTEETREHYNQTFTDLYNYLPQFIQDMQDMQLIYSADNVAKYRIRKDEIYGGQVVTVTYYIYFVIDEDGIWRIEIF